MAVLCSVWSLTTAGMAGDFNPFEDPFPLEETAAPMDPAPEPVTSESELQSLDMPPEPGHAPEGHGAYEEGMGEHGLHEEHGHEHFEHFEHHEHHVHHEHHHEEEPGNIHLMPRFREIESDLFDAVFDDMYSINLGTTFWQPEHCHNGFNTQTGLVVEFEYTALDGDNSTLIDSAVSNVFNIRETLVVQDADIYAGNIGLSFVANRCLPNSWSKWEVGVSPILSIGSLNAELEETIPTPGQRTIQLSRRASKNGTIVGGDFRLWTGIKTCTGFRAGLVGFYGVAKTDAIFDSSENFDTYGGGLYVEMPTNFIPHELPVPTGALQWFEEIFHLE
jgi:hypothetical protein